MTTKRYKALDVFRGLTVAMMILVNNPGSWSAIYSPLEHASWHGCTPTDLVFPFFLFAVGNAMAFVMFKFKQESQSSDFLTKVLKRSILIFLIGLFLNWMPFFKWDNNVLIFKEFQHLRILGVLQRIALAYLLASLLIYYFKPRYVLLISAIILLGYYAACYFLGSANDPFSLQGWFGKGIDMRLLGGVGHIYRGEKSEIPFDPEGFASTLPAVVNIVAGYFVGDYIRKNGAQLKVRKLWISGLLLVLLGLMWNLVFPINKSIWTSSYVLFTSGLAILVLSAIIMVIDVYKYEGFVSRFFEVFGKNPLFIFFVSGFLPRLLDLIRIPTAGGIQSPFSYFYIKVCIPLFSDERNSSLLYALIFVTVMWLLVYILDRKKIYIKV